MPERPKRRLGRGLEALIPGAAQLLEAEPRPGGPEMIPLNLISPNPYQPRMGFDAAGITALAESIRAQGILQPIVVARKPGGYELIVGERRLRAVKQLGWREIPAVVRETGREGTLLLALIENLQREDLGAVEEARAYQRLLEEFRLTQAEVAERVGKDRSTVANLVRLLQLPLEVQALVQEGALSMGHARALLGLEDERLQLALAGQAVKEDWSVRTLEQVVADRRRPLEKLRGRRARAGRPQGPLKAQIMSLEAELREVLGTQVRIKGNARGQGKIQISYYSWDDLHRVVGVVKKG